LYSRSIASRKAATPARDLAEVVELDAGLTARQLPAAYLPGYAAAAGELIELAPGEIETIRIDTLAQSFDIIDIINPGASTSF
jgi:hypothetical protein